MVRLFTSSAKALSKYTDMVDSTSREQLAKLADATDAARITLKQVSCEAREGKQAVIDQALRGGCGSMGVCNCYMLCRA